MAPFGEVLAALEDARIKSWSNRSPKHSVGMNRGHRGSSIGSLPNSHSQPIYVPGKYSVSLQFLCNVLQTVLLIKCPFISHQVVSLIKKKMKFMVLVMVYLRQELDAMHC